MNTNATDESLRKKAPVEFAGWRPQQWEEDIAIQCLDDQPFSNLGPPNSLDLAELKKQFGRKIDQGISNGQDLESFLVNDHFPVPGNQDREGYLTDFHEMFWIVGLRDFLRVQQACQQYSPNPKHIYEMGCASARVLRHFCAQGRFEKIWASDINFRHVRWVMNFLSTNVCAFQNSALPQLPMEDNSLDLYCAFSVFTHIDSFESGWLGEVRRVLKPEGIAYLTVHTESSWDAIRNNRSLPILNTMRKDSSFTESLLDIPLPSDRLIFRHSHRGAYRGCIFHTESYLRKQWGRWLDVLDLIPMHHGAYQTVIILKK